MPAVSGKVQSMASSEVEVRLEQGVEVQMGHRVGVVKINSRIHQVPAATDIKATRLAHQKIPQRTSKLGKTEALLPHQCLLQRGPNSHSPWCSNSQGVPRTPLCIIRSSQFWSLALVITHQKLDAVHDCRYSSPLSPTPLSTYISPAPMAIFSCHNTSILLFADTRPLITLQCGGTHPNPLTIGNVCCRLHGKK